MSKIKLSPKQDKFVKEYLKCGNATEAYRKSYNTKAHGDAIKVNAYKLLRSTHVALTIESIRAAARKRCEITVASQTEKLQVFIDMAVDLKEISAGTTAVMGQAKLHGLLQDPGISTITNNTQINISADNDLARKVAFMLAKAAQPTINVTKPLSNSEQSKD